MGMHRETIAEELADLEVAPGMAVRLAYCARDQATGELLQYGDDLCYVHGSAAEVFPKVQAALEGLRTGARVRVPLSPEEGYGERDPDRVLVQPRALLPEEACVPGMPMEATWPDGTASLCVVARVDGERVVLDANHPWAGRHLVFEFEVLSIRPALTAERNAGRILAPV